jgi:hypothetical protein
VPFLLNTDDVEPDRYSMNPLKQSIVDSGQSAFPAANVKTDQLKIDEAYMKKYDGSLISQKEAALITESLGDSNGSYLDLVDSIKYIQLKDLSEFFGMDLALYTLRMQPRLRFHRGGIHLHGPQFKKPHNPFNDTAFQEGLWL